MGFCNETASYVMFHPHLKHKPMPTLQWVCLHYDELSLQKLYAILALRQEVFIVEQDCPYLDADGKDTKAWHLCGYDKQGELVAYARLLPRGLAYSQHHSIGRVVTSTKIRSQGHGRPLMQQAILQCRSHLGKGGIKISAQYHLRFYYGSLGFQETGEVYDEDGIPHIAMVLP